MNEVKVKRGGEEDGVSVRVVIVREDAVDGRKIRKYRTLRLGRLEVMSAGDNIT